jgi:hypothetical protein
MSMWDGVSAIRTHGTAVVEPKHKRAFRKLTTRYRFVRLPTPRAALSVLRRGLLVGGVMRLEESTSQICVPVSVHSAYHVLESSESESESDSDKTEVACRAYGPRVVDDVRVDPNKLECMWALVRTRVAPPERCVLLPGADDTTA